MTMLDRMRRHKGWLKWSLGIVVVAFVLLYVPSFLRPQTSGMAPDDVIATVDGRQVLVATYQQMYQQQVDSLRSAYGDKFDDQMLKQLGVAQRVIQQLVEQEAVLAEAARLGIHVDDAELRERLLRLPAFQENGQFIGDARYRQLLDMQRPPLRPAQFESQLRDQLIAEKLQDAVTGWIQVSDEEVDREYRRRNEKVKLDLAIFTANQFRNGITPTDSELEAQYDAHKDQYKIPEKRRVRYLSIDAEALKSQMTVTPQEVQQRYQQNIQSYTTPEQIRASHILFKTDGKDEAAVRKLAESVLAKIKAGGDFAALAKQYSDDTGSKDKGGDLDYFSRGTMDKDFENAAWALKVGQVSGIVKTQFGLHIIKLTDRKPATTRTLDQVRPQIEDQIRYEKAQAEAAKIAEAAAKQIKTPADLDTVAREDNLSVGDSGLFARDEPLAGLGFAPDVASQAFTMQVGQVSGMLQTSQGYAFIALTDVKPSYVPKLDDVKDKVREDVIRDKALAIARTRAAAMAASAARGSFDAAAKTAGAELKTTDFIARGSALPEVGVSPAVDAAVFALKAGQTTQPISTNTAIVVAKVLDRQDVKPADLAAQRESLRSEMLDQRRGEFFQAYMTKAREKMKIELNSNTIKAILGNS
jgi:peptidyl-prolyl cis-trans isomerase D